MGVCPSSFYLALPTRPYPEMWRKRKTTCHKLPLHRIVPCGKYSSTLRKVRWRTPQGMAGHRAWAGVPVLRGVGGMPSVGAGRCREGLGLVWEMHEKFFLSGCTPFRAFRAKSAIVRLAFREGALPLAALRFPARRFVGIGAARLSGTATAGCRGGLAGRVFFCIFA